MNPWVINLAGCFSYNISLVELVLVTFLGGFLVCHILFDI